MWIYFKDGALSLSDKVCRKQRDNKSKEDTWQWNEESKKAIRRKKNAQKVMCR